ncbi:MULTISPECIES: glycosyltransferase family 2 protein [Pseudoalteromonas]|uniref:glycosyltransferase family 2 protein n=1 Tax=Pseudoalteromonas TaxID=53246 RepID=UPI0016031BF9|nr:MULTISPECIES: glycosyltransferase family 2 protein [Pseudoalteromonas]MBB1442453.1 glycosyltransferase family 2 protein [Pseudoalteromonas sp. SG43-3]
MSLKKVSSLFKNTQQEATICKDVAVIAVIKDESAYIHEWVHHYQYFGFKKIYLAINRTTDKTIEVLDLICSKYDNVEYFITDWIDKDADKTGINPNMQRLSFSFLANEAFKDPSITHCLSVDADEFFYPTCFKKDIKQFVNSFDFASKLSIHWACQEVDEEEFSAPFVNKGYYVTPQVKTIITRCTYENMRKFTLHVPLLKSNYNASHIDASGDTFEKGKHRELAAPSFNINQNAYILHRMVRSECEYLALLLRQNPESTSRVKKNRDGITKKAKLSYLDVPESHLKSYHDSLDEFIKYCNLAGMLNKIREDVKISALEILDIADEELLKDVDTYYKVLKGTSIFSSFHKRIKSIDYLNIIDEPLINKFRDIAISFEGVDLNVSLELMRIASRFRPGGNLIAHKVSQYEAQIIN